MNKVLDNAQKVERFTMLQKLEAKAADLRTKVEAIETMLIDPLTVQTTRDWTSLMLYRNSLLVDINTTETKILNVRNGRPVLGEVIKDVSVKGGLA
jgi:hypothetical protein